jgi:hypothetical protein
VPRTLLQLWKETETQRGDVEAVVGGGDGIEHSGPSGVRQRGPGGAGAALEDRRSASKVRGVVHAHGG